MTLIRSDINEENAYSGCVQAGDFVYLSFCVGNVDQAVEAQVHGALDDMERRLRPLGLGLAQVVQVDVLLRDAWNIPIMERVFKARFAGQYPARKTIQTLFAHEGLEVQIDAVAYRQPAPPAG